MSGSAFTGADEVLFGSVPATNFIVNSAGQLTAVAPPQLAGTVDVTVITPSGTSATSSSDHFTYSNATAPSVSSLSLTSGTTAGGTVVTISGSHFTGATAVDFGSVPADDFTVLSDGSIVATAPPQAAATVDVTVTTYSGTSATSSSDHFTYSNASLPTVSALSDTSGPATGGDAVTITGSYFTGATAVNFGSVTTSDFTVLSDSSILVTAPAQPAATVNVTVTTDSGTSTTYGSYTYNAVSAPAVTSLGTSSGSTAGGTLVEINGSGFTNAQEVDFGSAPLFDFTVNSDSLITAFTPPNYAGTIDVQVTTPAGTSAPVSADRFTYTAAAAPAVTSLGTSSGSTAGGTAVAITGTDLADAIDVFFAGVPAEGFFVNSSTSISAIAPPNPAGTVDVTVATFTGTSAVSSSDHFVYASAGAPTVTSLATSSGSTRRRHPGRHHRHRLHRGRQPSAFGSVPPPASPSTRTRSSPPSPRPGGRHRRRHRHHAQPAPSATVVVATTSPTARPRRPSVSGLSPATGTTAGGDTVVILGSDFTGATGVSFGSLAASSFTVNSDTSITAVAAARRRRHRGRHRHHLRRHLRPPARPTTTPTPTSAAPPRPSPPSAPTPAAPPAARSWPSRAAASPARPP